MDSEGIRWLPLESNPDLLNKYIENIGISTAKCQFVDVFGLEAELVAMVPHPVHAVLLLFPITEVTNKSDKEELQRIQNNPQTINNQVWFIKQTIANACGTIGVLHSLANNIQHLDLDPNSALAKFLANVHNLTPGERAKSLEEASDLAAAHDETAQQGQTAAPSIDEDVWNHFIVFVERGGSIYELDGRKPFPINHGPSSTETLLEDSVKIILEFMKRDPTQMNFSMMALVHPDN